MNNTAYRELEHPFTKLEPLLLNGNIDCDILETSKKAELWPLLEQLKLV